MCVFKYHAFIYFLQPLRRDPEHYILDPALCIRRRLDRSTYYRYKDLLYCTLNILPIHTVLGLAYCTPCTLQHIRTLLAERSMVLIARSFFHWPTNGGQNAR